MTQLALDLSPDTASKEKCYVRCGDCQHVWIAAYFPMEIGKAGKLLKHVRCPLCGADGKRIFLANRNDIDRVEGRSA